MLKRSRNFNQRGFTLIELMVVITILALLGGIVMPRVIGRLRQAKPEKAKMDLKITPRK